MPEQKKKRGQRTWKRTDVDVEQEYLNQYTMGRDSIFEKVTEEDEDMELKEWS